MNLLEKNALSVIGWLAFAGFYWLLVSLLRSWITNSRLDLASFKWSPFIYLALVLVVGFLVGF